MVDIVSEIAHLCYVKDTWTGRWVQKPDLVCLSLTDAAAPAHVTGQFQWRYGRAMRPEIGTRQADTNFAAVDRAHLTGYYVKVELSTGGSWYGILTERTDNPEGDLGGVAPIGTEQYTAFGLTILLEQSGGIRTSVVSGDTTIGLAIPFNGGAAQMPTGRNVTRKNKVVDKLEFGNARADQVEYWTADDAVKYLLEKLPVTNGSGTEIVPFQLATSIGLDFELPTLEYHGTDRWSLLNAIIDRRRGLGFRLELSEPNVLIRTFTHARTPIELPNGSTLPANDNQTTINLDNAINVSGFDVSGSAILQADQIRVIGERRGSVFTFSTDTGAEKDWSDASVDDYNTGRTGDTDWSGLSDEAKYKRNSEHRSRDQLSDVFSWWILPADWDATQGGKPIFPKLDENGNVDEAETTGRPIWVPGLTIADYVPMRAGAGVDYSGTVTPENSEVDTSGRDYLAPIIWFDDTLAEHLDAAADGDDSARTWSVQVRRRDDWPGLVFEVVGGQQHFIADDLYVSNGTYENTESEAQALDHDNWKATIYIQQQDELTAVWPPDSQVRSGDLVRRTDIRVPDLHLDYLVPGTQVDHKEGAAVVTEGGWLRDDRGRAEDIARLAWVWYGTVRQAVGFTYRHSLFQPSVGTLITHVISGGEAEEVNTVVTSVQLDLVQGRTTIRTQFAELDFAGLV